MDQVIRGLMREVIDLFSLRRFNNEFVFTEH